VLAVVCPTLDRAILSTVTKSLAATANDLVGCPMLYELATKLPELIVDALSSKIQTTPQQKAVERDNSKSSSRPPTTTAAIPTPSAQSTYDVVTDSAPPRKSSTRRGPSRRARPSEAAIKRESEQLLKDWRAWQVTNNYVEAEFSTKLVRSDSATADCRLIAPLLMSPQDSSSGEAVRMRRVRKSLPAAAQRGEVLQAAGGSQVVVISGATGCGKSTQASGARSLGSGVAVVLSIAPPRLSYTSLLMPESECQMSKFK
jgi:hypothetical protein